MIAIPNMIAGIIFLPLLGFSQFLMDCIIGLVSLIAVLFLNFYKNYLWATYWFFCYGFCLFILPLSIQMGRDSYMILFYFPMVTSMVQLLGRKETLKHLIILSTIGLIAMIATAVGFKLNLFHANINPEAITNMAVFNIILCALVTLAFTLVNVSESIRQERLIKKILREKEILLAEVFHRVKNNMTIVTSLLNLKKNMSDSMEVKNALEDCRNRVFSMALVHQKIFNTDNIIGLDFKDYVEKLLNELIQVLGDKENVEIVMKAEDITLELINAIPCGLILNELITNSLKHAQLPNKKLQIQITLKKVGDIIELDIKDNGPGLSKEDISGLHTLGLELIRSLSEQVSGTHSFYNNMGSCFNLKFKQAMPG